jgi:hypothetical protein
MRFPSIQGALSGAGATFRRFPLSLLSGLVACATALDGIDSSSDWSPRLLAVAVAGMALFTAARCAAEQPRERLSRLWLAYALLTAGLATVYALSLGWTDNLAALRLIQLLLLAHLTVAVAPYVRADRPNGFWQYNRFLLLRYLEASFYTLVLFAGLAIALGSLDKLFGVDVPGEAYPRLLAVLGFVFHPWFFLAGVPKDFEALDAREDYPLGLKVFSQFVLIPLVTVYLVILTAYLGKVVMTRTWPSGWIGYLVSCVSTAGVLALLLVHPIRRRGDTPWVNTYARWWFIALLPSLVMLLLAVSKRIGQYGVTEERYFLVVLTLWMLGISLYYGLTGSTNIKRIPETLLLVVALSAVGPWSAFAVSERSQVARLARVLEANGMGRPAHITRPRGEVSREDRTQVSAVFRYLSEMHGPSAIARVLGTPADSLRTRAGQATRFDDFDAREAMRRIGLEYVDRWSSGIDHAPFHANAPGRPSVDVEGFEVVRLFSLPITGRIGTAADSLEFATDSLGRSLAVKHGGAAIMTLDLAGPIRAALAGDSTRHQGGVTLPSPIVVEGDATGYRVRLVLETVYGEMTGTTLRVHGGNGFLMASGFKRPSQP